MHYNYKYSRSKITKNTALSALTTDNCYYYDHHLKIKNLLSLEKRKAIFQAPIGYY